MEHEIVSMLTGTFESHAQETEGGIEFWLARDLQHLLGYSEWRNFNTVISKAKTACEVSEHSILDHFVDVNKMVDIGSGGTREIDDIMLTRYACYLIAQNGDPKKEPIAFAQTYFALQTRKAALSNAENRRPNQTGRVRCSRWFMDCCVGVYQLAMRASGVRLVGLSVEDRSSFGGGG